MLKVVDIIEEILNAFDYSKYDVKISRESSIHNKEEIDTITQLREVAVKVINTRVEKLKVLHLQVILTYRVYLAINYTDNNEFITDTYKDLLELIPKKYSSLNNIKETMEIY